MSDNEKSKEAMYYEDQFNKLPPVDEFGVGIQLRCGGRSTFWMQVNDESVAALMKFLGNLPKENVPNDVHETPKRKWMLCKTTYGENVLGWHIVDDKYGSTAPICEHDTDKLRPVEEQLANAKLLTAAPEMLEALKIAEIYVACSCDGDYCKGTCDSAKIQDAIRKAE